MVSYIKPVTGCETGTGSSALRLLGVDLMLSPQSGQQRLLRQVLERAASRAPERLLRGGLVRGGVAAGVLLDGRHAGTVQRRQGCVGARGGAGLLGAARLETKGGGGGEGRRFEDPNRCGLQAAQELGILGKETVRVRWLKEQVVF